MMITNMCTNPKALITCALDGTSWTTIPVSGKTVGGNVAVSMTVWKKGGDATIQIGSSSPIKLTNDATVLRGIISQSTTTSFGMLVSGSATKVVVGTILICKEEEYTANKNLLDSMITFDGDTMPQA